MSAVARKGAKRHVADIFRQGCNQKDDKKQAELAEDDERLRAGALRQARVEGLELMRSVTGLLGQASAESGFSGVYRQKFYINTSLVAAEKKRS